MCDKSLVSAFFFSSNPIDLALSVQIQEPPLPAGLLCSHFPSLGQGVGAFLPHDLLSAKAAAMAFSWPVVWPFPACSWLPKVPRSQADL
jgi:hypothetical protein